MIPTQRVAKLGRKPWCLPAVIALLGACTTVETGGTPATGGTPRTGGNTATGGATATGGTLSTGGSATGGATATGGTLPTGGSATGGTATGGIATGGTVATGGTMATGGTVATGGTATGGIATGGGRTGGAPASGGSASGGTSTGGTSTGGVTATGGATITGGASATGGAIGTGGAGTSPCPTDGTPCKIMPFGDSITDGYNGDTPGGYRVELFRLAHAAGKNLTFVGSGSNGPTTVDGAPFPRNHEGHSGWTIDTVGGRTGISTLLKNDGSSVMVKYAPHIVLLMIGTNDAIDNYDMANAPARLSKLLDTIYAQLPKVFIVLAKPIPSRGDATKQDDTALSNRLKVYGDALPAVVKAKADAGKRILLIDLFTPFNANKAALLEDQWHPNLQGYVLIGAEWYSALKTLL
jgi:lysophospholipase L1-like esterase